MFRSFFRLSPRFHLQRDLQALEVVQPPFQPSVLHLGALSSQKHPHFNFLTKNSATTWPCNIFETIIRSLIANQPSIFSRKKFKFLPGPLLSLSLSLSLPHTFSHTNTLYRLTRSLEINYDSLLYRGPSCELGPKDFLLLFHSPSQCMLRAFFDW